MMEIQELNRLIDQKKDRLFSLLSDLIRINSENFASYGNEKECAERIAQQCRTLGLETDVYSPLDLPDFTAHPDYMEGRALENRLNVTARWAGADGQDALMLMGHNDTVPIGNPENWTVAPLGGEIRDGKIWGRGACDDKYAIATVLFLIELLKEQGFTPKSNLLFTAYCDEESGGSHGALAAGLRYPCRRIVNMDCKNFEIWHCASGGQILKFRYHTAQPVDSSAATARAFPVIMDVIDQFGARRREELERNPFYGGTIIPATSLRYMSCKVGAQGDGEISFGFYKDRSKEEIRQELTEMEHQLQKILAPLGLVSDGFFPATRFFHYVYSDPECDSIQDMCSAAKAATGRELHVCGSCLSDLSVILKYGSPEAFGFGIGRDFGAYGGAHQPDEYMECDTLVEYAKIIAAYLVRTLG